MAPPPEGLIDTSKPFFGTNTIVFPDPADNPLARTNLGSSVFTRLDELEKTSIFTRVAELEKNSIFSAMATLAAESPLTKLAQEGNSLFGTFDPSKIALGDTLSKVALSVPPTHFGFVNDAVVDVSGAVAFKSDQISTFGFTNTTVPQGIAIAKEKTVEDVYEELAEERKQRKELQYQFDELKKQLAKSQSDKQINAPQSPSIEELEELKPKIEAFMKVEGFVVWLKNKVEDARKAQLGMPTGDSLF